MDAPRHLFQDWISHLWPGTQRSPGETVQRWLAELRSAPPEKAAPALAARLAAWAPQERNLHMRLKLIGAFDEAAAELLPALEHALANAGLPLSPAARQTALAADTLLKALHEAYLALLDSVEGRKFAPSLAHLAHRAALGAMQALARRHLLAYRAYAAPSAASWLKLHALYQQARAKDIIGAERDGPSIERTYVAALLLGLSDPGKFERHDLPGVAQAIGALAPRVGLGAPDPAQPPGAEPGLYLVRPERGTPGRRLRGSDAEKLKRPDALILDCRDAIAALRQPEAIGTEGGEPGEATRRALLAAWAGTPARRFQRTSFMPRADLAVGLFDVLSLLDGNVLTRRREDAGRGHPPAVSEWSVLNESPDGFGIRYLGGATHDIEVGKIVALRPRENGKIHLCVVRRVSGGARLELGLQALSAEASAVTLPGPAGAAARAIVMPRLPGYGGAPGLVAAVGRINAATEITLGGRGHRPGHAVETSPGIDFRLLEPI